MANAKLLKMDLSNENRVHRSEQYKKKRRKHEQKMKIGGNQFVITEKILSHPVAISTWNRLVDTFKDFEYVNDADIDIIEQYCLTIASYDDLLNVKKDIEGMGLNRVDTYTELQKIKYYYEINKIRDMIIKLSDKLFINPVARMKNIPKFAEENKDTFLEDMGFGDL